MKQSFWLSFVDDTRFLGVVITRAATFAEALTRTHDLGINPGGDASGCILPEPYPDRYYDRLLQPCELRELGAAPESEIRG